MMDFGALPPEINSGLMYAGPGSVSMLAAATAWAGLAAELRSAATGYGSVLLDLTGTGWHGPSSAAMAAAAAPYVTWMHSTAAQAEQAGLQAATAAAAHQAAFAATVPPPLIAANRALLMALIATNFLGQNTPMIAATEADYGEMWAQDAAAMYGYAASLAAASVLSPMAVAPPTTTSAGVAGLANGVIAAGESAVTNLRGSVQGLAAQAAGAFQSEIGNVAGLLGMPLGQGAGTGTSGLSGTSAPSPAPAAPMRAPAPVPRPVVPQMMRPGLQPLSPAQPTMRAPEMQIPIRSVMSSAAMGQATSLGGLSVPSSWTTATSEAVAPAATPLASAGAAAPMMARGIPAGEVLMREMQSAELPRLVVLQPNLVG